MSFGAAAHEWLAQAIGGGTGALEIAPLQGATSSAVYLVRRGRDSNSERFVLRVLDNDEWLAQEPDLARHEAAALEQAQQAELRAPRLVAYSEDDVGFGAPVVLMTFVEGKIEIVPSDRQRWLAGLARELARIHRHRAESFGWRFRSWVNRERLAQPAWSRIPQTWARAIEFWERGAPDAEPVFVHRDYHPMNVLWQGDAVSGVVDWVNACCGPAGVDVAHCRTNLALMYGLPLADAFLDTYLQVADGFEYNPYWDVDSLLDVCFPQPKFYAPWAEFGIALVTPDALAERIDTYLEGVMRRV